MSTEILQRRAIFFDRDGTLNVEKHFLIDPAEFEWIDGAIDAIKFCNEHDFLTIVITNQSGIARGFFSETDVQNLHAWMNSELKKQNAHIDDFFYCPHHPEAVVEKYRLDCDCRKPKSGLFEQACRKYSIDRKNSLMIGDSDRDVESAENFGIRGIKFASGNLFDTLKQVLSAKN